MTGLLYKDFIAIHGKRIVIAMTILSAFLAGFTVCVSSEDFILVAGAAFLMLCMTLPLMIPVCVENWLFSADQGKKRKAYLLSLPFSKKQYVASKYIFILICYYVVLSVTTFWLLFATCAIEPYVNVEHFEAVGGLMPLYIYLCLMLSAFEMPFFILLGFKAGNAVKTGIFLFLFFAVMVYLFFGDLNVFERLNFADFIEYLEHHTEVVFALQTFGPILSGLFYYLSYRLSVTLFERKELSDEE